MRRGFPRAIRSKLSDVILSYKLMKRQKLLVRSMLERSGQLSCNCSCYFFVNRSPLMDLTLDPTSPTILKFNGRGVV